RNPALATLSGAVAVLAVVSTVAALWLSTALGESETNRHAAENAQVDTKYKLFESYEAQARAYRLSRRGGQRFAPLDTLAKAFHLRRSLDLAAERFDDLRNEPLATLAMSDLHVARRWDGWPAGSHCVDFDDWFEVYARSDNQGNVSIRRVADDAELHHLS